MNPASYQICTRCVMDTSDPAITFDAAGVCSHCHAFEDLKRDWKPNAEGRAELMRLADAIRAEGKSKPYDILIGVSGGVDSSYLMHVLKVELNLRPLALHVDAGWNSELAVSNIEKMVKKLEIDLYTHVVDWPEIRDLQLSFLKAGVANQDVPQDHIFAAEVLRYAAKSGIRHIANGSNLATEGILPVSWGYDASDSTQIRSIHKRFGQRPLRRYRPMSFWTRRIYFPYLRQISVIRPLNYLPYRKDEAMAFLQREYDWVYYGGKHYESRWTKFFQSYFLPRRFGYDKRRAHLASLVVTGEINRVEALDQLKTPPYDPKDIENDIEFVSKKLGIVRAELDSLLQQPLRDYSEYPNEVKLADGARRILSLVRSVRRTVGA